MAVKHVIQFEDMNFVEKGWGYERWIWNDKDYCGKILFFNEGKKCSFHFHAVKTETLYLASGKILMKYSMEDDIEKSEEEILLPGAAFNIPVNLRHQMIALEDSMIYEFSTHHEDSDSYRIVKGD